MKWNENKCNICGLSFGFAKFMFNFSFFNLLQLTGGFARLLIGGFWTCERERNCVENNFYGYIFAKINNIQFSFVCIKRDWQNLHYNLKALTFFFLFVCLLFVTLPLLLKVFFFPLLIFIVFFFFCWFFSMKIMKFL